MFLPDRYIKGECPKCGTPDQYGDVCENCSSTYAPTDLKNPYSVLTGAKPELRRSEHLFFRLSDAKVVAFLRQWTAATPLQAEVKNKIAEWLGGDEAGGKFADWTSRAMRRTSASRSRRPGSTSTSGSTRRSVISRA
jgi:methionyl-tRNA synthetase